MKHISIAIASILFSTLFYGKSIGLNLSVFSLLTIAFLATSNFKAFALRKVQLYAAAYLLTAVMVFVQHSYLSIIANCAAFFSLVGIISNTNASIYIHWLNGVYTGISGFFHKRINLPNEKKTLDFKKEIDYIHWAKLIGIPLVFVVLFVLLYKNGNPMFNSLISGISLDFINTQWLLFCVLGYYLFSNISEPIQVEPATSLDLNTENELEQSQNFQPENLKKEKELGTTLLGLLNLLILLFIVTDIIFLSSKTFTAASALSSQVHNGINALIASIIIAIFIILYVFRGDLNFYSKNKILKNLTYLWIFLNVVLIVLIAIKNQNYISAFGLTYKRIGVHVYILMAGIGLLTTFFKVMDVKNIAFLFRTNTAIAFAILIASCTINWDYSITKYNLNSAKSFDLNYLLHLSKRNASVLYQNRNKPNITDSQKDKITTKYNAYLTELKQRTWQEWSYDNLKFESDSKNL